jgi:hypothetical protein
MYLGMVKYPVQKRDSVLAVIAENLDFEGTVLS